jgi:N-acetylmuramoyl-L-alanine amidase
MYSIAYCAQLQFIAINGNSSKTSVIFRFNQVVQYHAFVLNHPDRIVVDFKKTNTRLNLKTVPLPHAQVSDVRVGHPNADTLRLVFDIPQASVLLNKGSFQSTGRQLAHELRIEWQPKILTGGRVFTVSPPAKQVVAIPTHTTNHEKYYSPHASGDIVVVLDPGHGGKDPGAIGTRGHVEKQVVLAIALKLKQLIDKKPGMRAVLTRQGDYYVGLRDRMTIARRNNADIFIAIHADAFINHASQGASVFALSPRGATSEAARWLAEKENHSELGGVNLSELNDDNGIIRSVLLDLSQTATIDASLHMGAQVLRQLGTMTVLHNQHVEQARFMVLKSPDIPSILIETGFISNLQEEHNLTNPVYQLRLAQAIVQGVQRYFSDYPPRHTKVPVMTHRYQVRPGESWSLIATRFHVSVAHLQTANHAMGRTLMAGQTLTIPVS